MTALDDLMADCGDQGIRLTVASNDGLKINAPRSALTADLVARLKAHKAELLAYLRGNVPTTDPWKVTFGPIDWPAEPDPLAVCRCGSREYLDVPIHHGKSTRRECAKCGEFVCFARWYGERM